MVQVKERMAATVEVVSRYAGVGGGGNDRKRRSWCCQNEGEGRTSFSKEASELDGFMTKDSLKTMVVFEIAKSMFSSVML